MPPSARHRPSLRSPSTVRARLPPKRGRKSRRRSRAPPGPRRSQHNEAIRGAIESGSRASTISTLSSKNPSRQRPGSGPRTRARRFFRGEQAAAEYDRFSVGFSALLRRKTAGSFAWPLSAITFAIAQRHVGTTACVRRCDYGADDN